MITIIANFIMAVNNYCSRYSLILSILYNGIMDVLPFFQFFINIFHAVILLYYNIFKDLFSSFSYIFNDVAELLPSFFYNPVPIFSF